MKQTLEFKGTPSEIFRAWKEIVYRTNFCADDKREAVDSVEDLMKEHTPKKMVVTIHYGN